MKWEKQIDFPDSATLKQDHTLKLTYLQLGYGDRCTEGTSSNSQRQLEPPRVHTLPCFLTEVTAVTHKDIQRHLLMTGLYWHLKNTRPALGHSLGGLTWGRTLRSVNTRLSCLQTPRGAWSTQRGPQESSAGSVPQEGVSE